MKILLPGGAGLVGQNLVARLKTQGYDDIVVLDKHPKNTQILRNMYPDCKIECVDLAERGEWEQHFLRADVVVMLQAQIGGYDYTDFFNNNIQATQNILAAMRRYQVPHLVHISSSVVESVADDYYTRSKKDQESIILQSEYACPILRPTLMFGWFDRKHLGWLSRFMQKIPIFPIPGNGQYIRQPLYARDFCDIIIQCIRDPMIKGIFNISGHEKIHYIDMIRAIKKTINSPVCIMKIPYGLFYSLLWVWGLFSKKPPFTTQQLAALKAKDEFEVIDWPRIFSVPYTPFTKAIEETFTHPKYSQITLEF